MSRIGKQKIDIPGNVKVSVKDHVVSVQGPLGTLTMTHRPDVKVAYSAEDKAVHVSIDEKDAEVRETRACWGTTRALIRNMVEGVTKGYEKSLEVVGVGWTAAVAGPKLKLTVGFANPLMVDIPQGVKVVVDKQIIRVNGSDKRAVGQFAAEVRAQRKPEPYNGKGIKFLDEVIKRKQGKAFGA
jgi:large subunit ribosomal protein L6